MLEGTTIDRIGFMRHGTSFIHNQMNINTPAPAPSLNSARYVLSKRLAVFGVCVLLLMLTPAIMILLFHIDGPELGRTGIGKFLSIAIVLIRMQIEPFLVALAITGYAVFSSSVRFKSVWITLALIGNALIGYFCVVVRSETGF